MWAGRLDPRSFLGRYCSETIENCKQYMNSVDGRTSFVKRYI